MGNEGLDFGILFAIISIIVTLLVDGFIEHKKETSESRKLKWTAGFIIYVFPPVAAFFVTAFITFSGLFKIIIAILLPIIIRMVFELSYEVKEQAYSETPLSEEGIKIKEYLRNGIISAMIAIIVTRLANKFVAEHILTSNWAIGEAPWEIVLAAYILPIIMAAFIGAFGGCYNVLISVIVGILVPILAIVVFILALVIVGIFISEETPLLIVSILLFMSIVGGGGIIIVIFTGG